MSNGDHWTEAQIRGAVLPGTTVEKQPDGSLLLTGANGQTEVYVPDGQGTYTRQQSRKVEGQEGGGQEGGGNGLPAGFQIYTDPLSKRRYLIDESLRTVTELKGQEGDLPYQVPPLSPDDLARYRSAGYEPVFNVSTQQWVPQRPEPEPPMEWRDVVMRKLVSKLPGEQEDAQRIWNFWNQMDPGAKVQLALQLATAPGDYITYWALTRGGVEAPNVPFEPGTRRIPLATYLTEFLKGQVPELFNLPVAKDETGQNLSNQQITTPPPVGPGQPRGTTPPQQPLPPPQQPTPPPANVPQPPRTEVPARERGPSPFYTPDANSERPYLDAGLVPQPQTAALATQAMSPVLLPQAMPQVQASGLPMVASSTGAGPVPVLPFDREVGIAGLRGPEINLLGEYGPEAIVPLRRNQAVGQMRLLPTASGSFPEISGQERQSVMRDLPAFGSLSGIRQPRLLPSLGAPGFPSAQQLRGFLPSEMQGFTRQVALGGFPVEDYLAQLQLQLGNFPPRRQTVQFLPQYVSSGLV